MFEKLKAILVENFDVNEEDITLDTELAADLGISSIDFADLVMTCETEFDIEIDDEAMNRLITVGDVVNYLEEHVAE